MGNTINKARHNQQSTDEQLPRAVVHKKILDVAKTEPELTIADLATEVNGASTHLVERVLDEYGDPANEETDVEVGTEAEADDDEKESVATNGDSDGEENSDKDTNQQETLEAPGSAVTNDEHSTNEAELSDESADESEILPETADTENRPEENTTNRASEIGDATNERSPSDSEEGGGADTLHEPSPVPDPHQLTEKQLKVLRAICEHPYATQAQLAELFSISRATISQRVNRIDGFKWRNRKEIVDKMFNSNNNSANSRKPNRQDGALSSQLDDLTERIDTLEQTVAEEGRNSSLPTANSELSAKVIKACIEFEGITEDEEVQIISSLINSESP